MPLHVLWPFWTVVLHLLSHAEVLQEGGFLMLKKMLLHDLAAKVLLHPVHVVPPLSAWHLLVLDVVLALVEDVVVI